MVGASGTVVMRGGTYNESVAISKSVTVQNYPGEAVWLDGSTEVGGWVKDGTRWRRDGWKTTFDHSPTYTKGAPDSTDQYWQFVNKGTHPMAAHPDQVWIDGSYQTQVASLAQVAAGKFFFDEGRGALYVGSDPSGKRVDASNLPQAMNIRASNVVVRGIGIRRYAPSVWHVGAVTLERPNITFENVMVSDMATTGLSVQSTGARLTRVTVQYAGMLGVHGGNADNLIFDRVLALGNNRERFNIAPVSGGVKLGKTRGVQVINSNFTQNQGPGFWEDMSVYNTVVRGSNFTKNEGDGLFLEISAKVVVGDSLFANNKLDGIKVNNTSNVQIWNNTFVGNARPLDLVQDTRRNTDPNDSAVDRRISFPDPEMPWQLRNVRVSNNVVGLSTSAANCLLCVEDYSRKDSGQAMGVVANGNVYVRANALQPTWVAIWSRAPVNGNPYIFSTLAELRSTTGQEARGREYTNGTASLAADGVLASGIQSASGEIALGLPSDVATLIGRPSGSTRLGAWADGGAPAGANNPPANPPATNPPTNPPATTPPATNPPAATTGMLAQDGFERSAAFGWGSANAGGAWQVPVAADRFKVAGGSGQVSLGAGDGFAAHLSSVSSTQTDLKLAFSLSQAAKNNGHFVEILGRRVGSSDYRLKVGVGSDGKVSTWVTRNDNGRDVLLDSKATGLDYKVGETLLVRLQVTGKGTTAVKAKVWKSGAAQPDAWTVSGTDSASALQAPGSVGIYAYSDGSATGAATIVYFDELRVDAID